MNDVIFTDKTINMKRSLILFIFSIFLVQLTYSESTGVSAPFVSRLKATAGVNTIKLTWLDSEDAIEEYSVYRSAEIISNTNFLSAVRIGTVPQGKQIFIDIPKATEPYYYSVLAIDNTANEYKLFIPYRNITMEPVSITSVSSPDELAAKIRNIKAAVFDNKIKLTFDSSKPEREVAVYRSTSPIQELEDISNSTLAGIIPSSQDFFIDKPVPGISYYYAIFDSELTKSGNFSFVPGENITLNSIETPLTLDSITPYTVRTVRTEPLPYLDFFPSIETGTTFNNSDFTLPSTVPFSPSVSTLVAELLSNLKSEAPPVPDLYIFPSDKDAVENSETYRLVRILKTDFINKNWPEAYKLLGDYLSVRHTRDVVLRTHFYLGQVLYYEGSYLNAINEFVLAEGDFYSETKPWLDSLLYLIQNEDLF